MNRSALLILLSLFFMTSCSSENTEPSAPPAQNEYTEQIMSGFTVKYKTTAATHIDMVSALSLMKTNLEEITRLLADTVIAAVQKHPIWIELNIKPDGAAWYHANKQWVIDNQMNPEKAKCVEICHAGNYYNWTRSNQPYMVLHELIHLYHDQVLTYNHQGVKSAYQHAMQSGRYEAVDYFNGSTVTKAKAYAMNNDTEYFSEISEAYFGKNDYYPFNYNDLKEFDPEGFALMETVWGKRQPVNP